MNESILDKYDSHEEVPAAVKAWITMRAIKAGKNPIMVHAGYKAHFKRIQNLTTLTLLKEDAGYMGGGVYAEPYYHMVKARNVAMLKEKIGSICDEIIETGVIGSQDYKDASQEKTCQINKIVDDLDEVKILGVSLKIVSDPDFITLR